MKRVATNQMFHKIMLKMIILEKALSDKVDRKTVVELEERVK